MRTKAASLGFKSVWCTTGFMYVPYGICWRLQGCTLGPRILTNKAYFTLLPDGSLVMTMSQHNAGSDVGTRQHIRMADIDTVILFLRGWHRPSEDTVFKPFYLRKEGEGTPVGLYFYPLQEEVGFFDQEGRPLYAGRREGGDQYAAYTARDNDRTDGDEVRDQPLELADDALP